MWSLLTQQGSKVFIGHLKTSAISSLVFHSDFLEKLSHAGQKVQITCMKKIARANGPQLRWSYTLKIAFFVHLAEFLKMLLMDTLTIPLHYSVVFWGKKCHTKT